MVPLTLERHQRGETASSLSKAASGDLARVAIAAVVIN